MEWIDPLLPLFCSEKAEVDGANLFFTKENCKRYIS